MIHFNSIFTRTANTHCLWIFIHIFLPSSLMIHPIIIYWSKVFCSLSHPWALINSGHSWTKRSGYSLRTITTTIIRTKMIVLHFLKLESSLVFGDAFKFRMSFHNLARCLPLHFRGCFWVHLEWITIICIVKAWLWVVAIGELALVWFNWEDGKPVGLLRLACFFVWIFSIIFMPTCEIMVVLGL